MVKDSSITLMYTGPGPVKIEGLKPLEGKKDVEPGDIIPVPDTIANNLARDRFWSILSNQALEALEKTAATPQAGKVEGQKAGDTSKGGETGKEKKKEEKK
ncbi:MAG: hypothetical protein KAW12_13430 [Candidatus Aminicenantes bacterium]|nr:hypothetical protein [Candidatus Aminicenantes bacterium]